MKNKIFFRDEDLTHLYESNNLVKLKKCVVCDASEASFLPWGSSGQFPSDQCQQCGLVFMNPQLTKEGLDDYYKNYINRRRLNNEIKMQQRFSQYQIDREVIRRFIKNGNLLDIGCSGGFFLDVLGDEFTRFGTELDAEAVSYLRSQFPKFEKNIHCGTLISASYPDSQFDLVTLRGVIEHVPDPIEVLCELSRITRSGGYCYICATPNADSVLANIFKENWTLFHPVQHLWHFSPSTLEKLFNQYGFILVWKDFPYVGTPYENFTEDVRTINAFLNGDSTKVSPPFFESMMSLVFKKI